MKLENIIIEKIVHLSNGSWQVQSEKGKNLGTYDTKEEAEKRLQQVHYFKHMDEDVDFETTNDLTTNLEWDVTKDFYDEVIERRAFLPKDRRRLFMDLVANVYDISIIEPYVDTCDWYALDIPNDRYGLHNTYIQILDAEGFPPDGFNQRGLYVDEDVFDEVTADVVKEDLEIDDNPYGDDWKQYHDTETENSLPLNVVEHLINNYGHESLWHIAMFMPGVEDEELFFSGYWINGRTFEFPEMVEYLNGKMTFDEAFSRFKRAINEMEGMKIVIEFDFSRYLDQSLVDDYGLNPFDDYPILSNSTLKIEPKILEDLEIDTEWSHTVKQPWDKDSPNTFDIYNIGVNNKQEFFDAILEIKEENPNITDETITYVLGFGPSEFDDALSWIWLYVPEDANIDKGDIMYQFKGELLIFKDTEPVNLFRAPIYNRIPYLAKKLIDILIKE